MASSTTPSVRFKPVILIALAAAIAGLNAIISFVMVALATPGSGTIGPGFRVISLTFLIGNIALFGFAILMSTQARKRIQIVGLLIQLLTVPVCLVIALAILYLFGIDTL